MKNSIIYLLHIIGFLVITGCIISSYFIGSYFQFTNWKAVYGDTHNMTTGCLLNETSCRHELYCHEVFYHRCIFGGIFGVIISIAPLTIISMTTIKIIYDINKCYSNKIDENTILINANNNDDIIYQL